MTTAGCSDGQPSAVGWRSADEAPAGSERGVVVRAHGRFFVVDLQDRPGSRLATPKGSLKRNTVKTDVVAVGDRVWVVDAGGGEVRIDLVEPRSSVLARTARLTTDVQQVILANPDQVLFLFSVLHPEPHLRMLDRFLILAEKEGVPALIGVNKVDLEPPGDPPLSRRTFGHYEAAYPVHYLSTRSGDGIPDLRRRLSGKVTAIAGPSGVGKSSLLNLLDPDYSHDVAEISAATGKGRHKTIGALLRRIDDQTYVADTPGMRSLAMHAISPELLENYFPEFRPFLGRCQFANCSHLSEPGCLVKQAAMDGAISRDRYDSFSALRRGERRPD